MSAWIFGVLTIVISLIAKFVSAATGLTVAVPLHASSRWILDANNDRFKFRCANWAGHLELNIPEGLQWLPVDQIASWVSSNNFNCIRLTYSIDMALDPDQSVEASFNNAATSTGVGLTVMQGLYSDVLAQNPWIANATTRSTFATVIDALAAENVVVILDNHVSKAQWCCNETDGNGWWDTAPNYDATNSRYFNTTNWVAGLSAMATFAKSYPNVVAQSVRNELRSAGEQNTDSGDADWYEFVAKGAVAIYDANPDLLVVIGGPNYATDLSFLYSKPMTTSSWGGAAKTLFEFHSYYWSYSYSSYTCSVIDTTLGDNIGFILEQGKSYTGPLWLSEFGFNQGSGISADEQAFISCLVPYMEDNDADWSIWALQGSYYVRAGEVNYDETYGVLNHNWTGWRNSTTPATLGNMWKMTQGP